MKQDIEDYCRSCLCCIQRKTLPTRAAPLGQLESGGPSELVCIDFLSIEPDEGGISNVLVVTDHYTRYAQAFPARDQKALTVAKMLVERFFVHYGLPKRIHSDQGRDFESKLVRELLTLLGVQKSRTTPYHPQGDAQPERFNRTLLDMLGTLSIEKKSHWSRHVATVVHAYNSTKNDATGFSPYFLMFGREARLPVDLTFGVSADDTPVNSHASYVERLKKGLKQAYELAEISSGQRHQQNKARYDKKVKVHDLQPGDRVLLRNVGLQGKHKLANRWGSDFYIICSKLPNIPVYQVRPEGKEGPIKTWHRNNLMPLAESVRMINSEPKQAQGKLNSRRSRRLQRKGETTQSAEEPVTHLDGEEDSDSEWGIDGLFYDSMQNPIESDLNANALEFVPCQVDQSKTDTCLEGSSVLNEQQNESCPLPTMDNELLFAVNPNVGDSQFTPEIEAITSEETKCVNDAPRVEPCSPVNTSELRPPRQIRPPQRLTYDTMGNSTEEPVSTAHRGVYAHVPCALCSKGDTLPTSMCIDDTPWWNVPFDYSSNVELVVI